MKFFSTWERLRAAYPDKDVRWQASDEDARAWEQGARALTARVCDHPPGSMVPDGDGFRCVRCGERFADKKKDGAKTITVRLVREAS